MSDSAYGASPFHKEIVGVRHNPLDHDAYKRFMARQDSIFEGNKAEREFIQNEKNAQAWLRSLSNPWNLAVLKNSDDKKAVEAFLAITDKQGLANIFVQGDPSSGKTFLAYAMIHHYIAEGLLTPSQVKVIKQDRVLGDMKKGFKGRVEIDEIYSKRYKMYLVDDMGPNVSTLTGSATQYSDFWDLFLNHITENDLRLICVSDFSPLEVVKSFNKSSASKMRRLLRKNIIATSQDTREEFDGIPYTAADIKAQKERENTRDRINLF